MESDAMSVVDYYIPVRITLKGTPDEHLTRMPNFASDNPRFGSIVLGNSQDSLYTVAVDESEDAEASRLYVDRNNNEDLTDDGDATWDEEKSTYRSKEALIDLAYEGLVSPVPYPVVFYRYRHRLQDELIAYRNGYRVGQFFVDDSSYKVAIFDDDLNGRFDELDRGALLVDLNGDGSLDGSDDSNEIYALNQPFVLGERVYRVSRISPPGDVVYFTRADTMLYLREDLLAGMNAPSFRAYGIDGTIVDLDDYRGKVVLLDFWATWCKPWQKELPALQNVYRKYQSRGLEIIGMNLDYDLELVKTFLSENDIRWPQIANGRGWDMPLADLFKVSGIPKKLLIDRKGIVRFKDLHSKNLEARVHDLLSESSNSAN
jgi:thiol-disulfide isomerase/thioredoxin